MNVYPVPDGDTGTNMALTLESVVSELEAVEAGARMAGVCKAIAHGSLMGARGNSGVILSQLLRGMGERLGGREAVRPDLLAEALPAPPNSPARRWSVLSRGPSSPWLGGRGGSTSTRAGLVGVVHESARIAAADALARTPEMLPVLAQAGVVDGGGAGFVLLLDAFLHVVDGRPLPELAPSPDSGDQGGMAARGTRRGGATAGSRRPALRGHVPASDARRLH